MKLNLINEETKEVIEVTEEVSIVGRSSKCDITIPDPKVSKRHCRIEKKGDAVNIEDLGSTNHTHVPGKKLKEKGDGATVKHGDTFIIGRTKLTIQINDQPLPVDDEEIKLAPEDSGSGVFEITDEDLVEEETDMSKKDLAEEEKQQS